jgi:hypothetical protein
MPIRAITPESYFGCAILLCSSRRRSCPRNIRPEYDDEDENDDDSRRTKILVRLHSEVWPSQELKSRLEPEARAREMTELDRFGELCRQQVNIERPAVFARGSRRLSASAVSFAAAFRIQHSASLRLFVVGTPSSHNRTLDQDSIPIATVTAAVG